MMDSETQRLMKQGGAGRIDPDNAPFESFVTPGAPIPVVPAPSTLTAPASAYADDGEAPDWTPTAGYGSAGQNRAPAEPGEGSPLDSLLVITPDDFEKIGLVLMQYDNNTVDIGVAAEDLRATFDPLMNELMAQLMRQPEAVRVDSEDAEAWQQETLQMKEALRKAENEIAVQASEYEFQIQQLEQRKATSSPDSLYRALLTELVQHLDLDASKLTVMADSIVEKVCG